MSSESPDRAPLPRLLQRLRHVRTFEEALFLAAVDMPRPTEREYPSRVNLLRFLGAFRRERSLGRLTLARTDDLTAFSTEEARAYLAMLDRFRRAGQIRKEDVARVRLRLRCTATHAADMGQAPPTPLSPRSSPSRAVPGTENA